MRCIYLFYLPILNLQKMQVSKQKYLTQQHLEFYTINNLSAISANLKHEAIWQCDFVLHKTIVIEILLQYTNYHVCYILMLVYSFVDESFVTFRNCWQTLMRVVPSKVDGHLCYPLFKCINLTPSSKKQLKKDLARHRQKEGKV